MTLDMIASAISSRCSDVLNIIVMFTKVNLDATMDGQSQDEEVGLDVMVRKEGYCRIHD